MFWPQRLRTYLPAPLAALIVGTICGVTVFTQAPVIGEVPTGIPQLQLPIIGLETLSTLIQPALILALLGSIDSLLDLTGR